MKGGVAISLLFALSELSIWRCGCVVSNRVLYWKITEEVIGDSCATRLLVLWIENEKHIVCWSESSLSCTWLSSKVQCMYNILPVLDMANWSRCMNGACRCTVKAMSQPIECTFPFLVVVLVLSQSRVAAQYLPVMWSAVQCNMNEMSKCYWCFKNLVGVSEALMSEALIAEALLSEERGCVGCFAYKYACTYPRSDESRLWFGVRIEGAGMWSMESGKILLTLRRGPCAENHL